MTKRYSQINFIGIVAFKVERAGTSFAHTTVDLMVCLLLAKRWSDEFRMS